MKFDRRSLIFLTLSGSELQRSTAVRRRTVTRIQLETSEQLGLGDTSHCLPIINMSYIIAIHRPFSSSHDARRCQLVLCFRTICAVNTAAAVDRAQADRDLLTVTYFHDHAHYLRYLKQPF